MEQTKQLLLDDGRQLAYAEYGDPAGAPLLYFHGLPGSRLEAALVDALARRERMRIVAPDRPGFGCSDPQPKRRLIDWPADVLALVGALDIDRFQLIGVSGGAPYAIACAITFNSRVSGVTLISGVAPFRDPDGGVLARPLLGNFPSWRYLFKALPMLRHLGDPERSIASLDLPPSDREALQHTALPETLFPSIREGMRQGSRGVRSDLRILGHPWRVSPRRLHAPVQVWHGEADSIVPVAAARYYAGVLPRATLHLRPDEGHFSLPVNHLSDILVEVRAMAAAAQAT